jgi:hypothetical protein
MTWLLSLLLSGSLGLGVAWQQGGDYAAHAVATLQPDVWYDWRWDGSDAPEYMPMVHTMERGGWADAALQRSQGDTRMWMLGNEPDWGYTYTSPRDAAAFAQWWAEGTDAPWACCGVIVTTGDHWSAWMAHYLLFGGPIPDAYHLHIYNGGAHNWMAHVESFRTWARNRGVERPIIVSETAAPNADMAYNVALLRAIQAHVAEDPALTVLWYSAHDHWQVWPTTNLLDADGALTALGHAFVAGPVGQSDHVLYMPWVR